MLHVMNVNIHSTTPMGAGGELLRDGKLGIVP